MDCTVELRCQCITLDCAVSISSSSFVFWTFNHVFSMMKLQFCPSLFSPSCSSDPFFTSSKFYLFWFCDQIEVSVTYTITTHYYWIHNNQENSVKDLSYMIALSNPTFRESMGAVLSQPRGDSFGFPGLPHSQDFGQPGSYKYIWDTDQTKRNNFGTTNNQLSFWFNYAVLSIPFLPDDCSIKRSALDRQVAVSLDL